MDPKSKIIRRRKGAPAAAEKAEVPEERTVIISHDAGGRVGVGGPDA